MRLIAVFLILFFTTISYAGELISKDYLMGRFRPGSDRRFQYAGGFYLRREAFSAFFEMQRAAAKSGIRLRIVSATRTFNEQKRLWEDKWFARTPVNTDTYEYLPKPYSRNDTLSPENRALRILEFTAMPSASRHHWGTDLDLNNVNSSYWETARGRREYEWLRTNAGSYGFCQVYSADRINGYKEEKWHWSFIPLSRQFTFEFANVITDRDIAGMGFKGAETALRLNFVEKFVLGLDENCK